MSFWSKPRTTASARRQIQIQEVRDTILVLNPHEYRMVVETSSINFELKSDAEQDVIIDSFQHFLNSLPSPIQIVVRVREMDIDRYVESMNSLKKKETEETYKEQITRYTTFIRTLVSGHKILTRRFYVVIPYHTDDARQDFAITTEHLSLQRDIVSKGLERLGMKATPLQGIELLELFYSFYNPVGSKLQPLKEEALNALRENPYV